MLSRPSTFPRPAMFDWPASRKSCIALDVASGASGAVGSLGAVG